MGHMVRPDFVLMDYEEVSQTVPPYYPPGIHSVQLKGSLRACLTGKTRLNGQLERKGHDARIPALKSRVVVWEKEAGALSVVDSASDATSPVPPPRRQQSDQLPAHFLEWYSLYV